MKAFGKTIWRTFGENKGRIIGNSLIVLISLALSGGLAVMPSLYEDAYVRNNYEGKNVPDIILKNKTEEGFSETDLQKIKNDEEVEDAISLINVDYESENDIYRIYIQDLDTEISKLTLLEGNKPTTTYDFSSNIQVLALEGNLNREQYKIGDVVTISLNELGKMFGDIDISSILGFSSVKFEVIGIVSSPLYNSVQKENAMLDSDDERYIKSAFFLDERLLPEKISVSINGRKKSVPISAFLTYTDIHIVYKNKNPYFSDAYKKEMSERGESLKNEFGLENVETLTLEENVSYNLFKTYNEKVRKITYVFPIFFIVVCALVNLITISRLIKDERAQIATYLSLGVSKGKIIFKYVLFSFITVLFGGLSGLLIGLPLVPKVVLPAYQSIFEMSNELSITFFNLSSYLLFTIILLISIGVTLYCSLKLFLETPASLMQTPAPKAGKKIFLEKINFLWKSLPFRYKSSFRNIFRQKKNFFLTSLSIIGSTVLLMLGFGLLDISEALKNDSLFGNVASSMGSISLVIVIFALAMAVVVVYSLTNMNIQDRVREIATLKVLGYHDNECSMYTFREIMIISVFASLVGLPISALLIYYVFGWLDFGSIKDVRWYSYVFSFAIVIFSTIIVNFLLNPKIKCVDMNDSLKTLD